MWNKHQKKLISYPRACLLYRSSFSLEYLLLSSEPQRGSLPLHCLDRWQTSLSFALLYYKETLPVPFLCSEVQWAQWIATRMSENALHSNAHICATWKQWKGIKTSKSKTSKCVIQGFEVFALCSSNSSAMKCHWIFLNECRQSDLASAGCSCPGAEHLPSTASELWCSMHVLIPMGPISSFIFLLLEGERKNGIVRVCIVKVWS